MNTKRIGFVIGMVLAILAAPAMAGPNTMYFTNYSGPDDNGIGYVEIWLNLTDEDGIAPPFGLAGVTADIDIDPSRGEIPDDGFHTIDGHPWDDQCDCNTYINNGAWIVTRSSVSPPKWGMDPGVYPVMNITIKCYEGCSGPLDLIFDRTEPEKSEMNDAGGNIYPNQVWEHGQFPCVGSQVTFEKELIQGWNLVSLPLMPDDNSTSVVLTGTMDYDAVYRYDAEIKQFKDAATMDPGIGYFVNVTTAGTWSYEGTAYNSMSVDLKQGLNLVGWLNTSEELPDAFDSIAGEYNYVARWDPTSPDYEVYDANAPSGVLEFIDFETMERGNGYWIAAKADCTLAAS